MTVTPSPTQPKPWLAKLSDLLVSLEKKPQFGTPLEFPWEKTAAILSKILGKEVSLTSSTKGWVAPDALLEGVGEKIIPLAVLFAPLEEPLYWVMSESDLKGLTGVAFCGEAEGISLIEKTLGEGFYHYLATEVLMGLDTAGFAAPFGPRLGVTPTDLASRLHETPAFVIDVTIAVGERSFFGRLLLTAPFREGWVKQSLQIKPKGHPWERMGHLPVDLGLQVGAVRLTVSDWRGVQGGDVLLLDEWSYDPKAQTGRLLITLDEKILFRAKVGKEGLKILEYPTYEEIAAPMDEENAFEEEENLYGDLQEEEEGFGEFQEGLEEPSEEAEAAEKRKVVTEKTPSEKSPLAPEQLPMRLTVEVARLRMTVKEIMELAPGNLLELDVPVADGVDLVVEGKRVGRGELVKVGEMLGVRILEL